MHEVTMNGRGHGLEPISNRLVDEILTFIATLLTDYVPGPALDQLMAVVPDELGVHGAGVMLAEDDGELRFVSASDDVVRLIEQFQIETGEGPCVSAYRSHERVFLDDLAADDRFPNFDQLALGVGMSAVHSFPMVVEGTAVGAMNIYSRSTGRLTPEAIRAGEVITQMCTAYLISARHADSATRMMERTRQAMDRNAPIEQAKGFVAHALQVSPDEAYEMIRRRARSEQAKSLDVSSRILSGDIPVGDLRG